MVAIDAAPEPAKFMRKFEIPGFVYSVGAVAALLLIWEALVATGIISSFLLPAPLPNFPVACRQFLAHPVHERGDDRRISAWLRYGCPRRAAAWRAHCLFAADTAHHLPVARCLPKHSEARHRAYHDRLARHGSYLQSGDRLCHRLFPYRGRYGDWTAFCTRRNRAISSGPWAATRSTFSAMSASRMRCPQFSVA